jgi:DEAD/DEAH box helicase
MADAYCHPSMIQNHVHAIETTVDLVRRQAFHTTSLAGKKRTSAHDPLAAAPTKQILPDVQSAFVPHFQPLPPSRLQASLITPAPLLNESKEGVQLSEYSQRRCLASTPGPSQNPLLSLRHQRYGLPQQLASNFESLGVHSIYPWQSSCLLGKGVLSGATNLIYTAPTGGGKSLVADVLLLTRIIENPSKKAILVLPYVALVQEKLKWFRNLVEGVPKDVSDLHDLDTRSNPKLQWKLPSSHIRVAGFFGGSKARASWADIDIAICTIEKVCVIPFHSLSSLTCFQANSLVNSAVEEGRIDELGIVVLDELHMIDEENRGYLMELMVTKLLVLQQNIQLVGMSATLSVVISVQPVVHGSLSSRIQNC